MVILRVKGVVSRLKIGKSTLYDWLNHKSPRFKGGFPRPVNISETMVGWLEDEINNWLESMTTPVFVILIQIILLACINLSGVLIGFYACTSMSSAPDEPYKLERQFSCHS